LHAWRLRSISVGGEVYANSTAERARLCKVKAPRWRPGGRGRVVVDVPVTAVEVEVEVEGERVCASVAVSVASSVLLLVLLVMTRGSSDVGVTRRVVCEDAVWVTQRVSALQADVGAVRWVSEGRQLENMRM
jgi:hypothetical protein